MNRPGRLDVELIHHRKAIKTWVIGRLAVTADQTDQAREATAWFHDLPLEVRSRLITDLAFLNVKTADLKAIGSGPLGDLLDRFPGLFPVEAQVAPAPEIRQEVREAVTVSAGARPETEYAVPAWFSSWKEFEPEIEDSVWPGM